VLHLKATSCVTAQEATTYEIRLWGMTSTSNFEKESFEFKFLLMIVDVPWKVPNTFIRKGFLTPAVKEEIHHYSSQYSARISAHPNDPVENLKAQTQNTRLPRNAIRSAYQIPSVILVFMI
jgi:hypothetical protein